MGDDNAGYFCEVYAKTRGCGCKRSIMYLEFFQRFNSVQGILRIRVKAALKKNFKFTFSIMKCNRSRNIVNMSFLFAANLGELNKAINKIRYARLHYTD